MGLYSADECLQEVLASFGKDLAGLITGDTKWTDLMVNPDGRVWVDSSGMEEVQCIIPRNGLLAAATTLASYAGASFNGREGQSLACVIPVLGLRAEFIGPPAAKAVSMVVRRPAPRVWTLNDLLAIRTVGEEQKETLVKAVRNRVNIIVSGGTASGKTTFTNALLSEVDGSDRLYVVEDVDELKLSQPNAIKLLVNADYPYCRAIADALRCRPDRIIVGECRRGDQVLEMIKAWNTGHPGGVATIHANDARSAVLRLDQLISEVSASSQLGIIRDTVGLIVHMDRTHGSGERRVTQILDVFRDELIYENGQE